MGLEQFAKGVFHKFWESFYETVEVRIQIWFESGELFKICGGCGKLLK